MLQILNLTSEYQFIRAAMTAGINQYFNASVSMQVNDFTLKHISFSQPKYLKFPIYQNRAPKCKEMQNVNRIAIQTPIEKFKKLGKY